VTGAAQSDEDEAAASSAAPLTPAEASAVASEVTVKVLVVVDDVVRVGVAEEEVDSVSYMVL